LYYFAEEGRMKTIYENKILKNIYLVYLVKRAYYRDSAFVLHHFKNQAFDPGFQEEKK
jgi:hypothetical protein